MSDFVYAEFCKGVTDRGNVYNVKSLLNLDSSNTGIVDHFASVYLHCEHFLKHSDSSGGKKGYEGPVKAEYVHWDFDSDHALMKAYRDSKTLINTLTTKFDVILDQIRFYFSGGKGFHVYLISPEFKILDGRDVIPNLVRSVASSVSSGLSTFDDSVYDRTRIFRIPNSKHGKTGLYKIPISIIHDYTEEQILDQAKKPQFMNWPSPDGFERNKKIQDLINQCYNENKSHVKVRPKYSGNDLIDGILNGFPEGQRNNGLFSLAAMLHKKGCDVRLISAIINTVNEHRKMNLPYNEIDSIIGSVYKYPVENREPVETNILTMVDAAQKWYNQHKTMKKVDYGFTKMNQCMSSFSPGEVLYIAGRAGTGKTTLGMIIGNNLSKTSGEYSLMVSLEMQSARVFFRAAGITTCVRNKAGVENDLLANMLTERRTMERICSEWSRFLIVDKDSLSLEQIEEYYILGREKYLNIPFLIIDYLGYISNDKKGSQYDKVTQTAKAVKGLAKRLDIRIIMLCQTNRNSEDGTQPVKLHHMRDSGAIEESADGILGIWKSKSDRSRLHCELLKNRNDIDGQKFDFIRTGLMLEDADYLEDVNDVKEEQGF